jgi:hypothetical protein
MDMDFSSSSYCPSIFCIVIFVKINDTWHVKIDIQLKEFIVFCLLIYLSHNIVEHDLGTIVEILSYATISYVTMCN